MNLTDEQIGIIRDLAKRFIIETITFVNDFSQNWSLGYESSLYVPYKSWVEITQGSPESGNYTSSSPTTYAISGEILTKKIIITIFKAKLNFRLKIGP